MTTPYEQFDDVSIDDDESGDGHVTNHVTSIEDEWSQGDIGGVHTGDSPTFIPANLGSINSDVSTDQMVGNGAGDAPEVIVNGQIQYIPDGKDSELSKLTERRLKVKKFVEHLYVRIFGCIIVIVDISVVIADIAMDPENKSAIEIYDVISLSIWTYFLVEILLRIFANGKMFFRTPFPDLMDLSIVVITGIVTFTYVIADFSGVNSDYGKLILICRFIRILMLARLISERRHLTKASRRMVSENKRRYRSDGFDLDLTYITDRVIASSFPSSGSQSLYRNPIAEVSRFLNTKHPGHYKVCNLCSEKHYDESFFNNRVARFPIDDHNVPLLQELQNFTSKCNQWIKEDPETVLFVHCKGGKGRTGLMICSWLLENELYPTAQECLEHFGQRRTDYEEGSKFQGVQTPSQARYVGYYEKLKHIHQGVIPTPRQLKLQSIKLEHLKGVGKGDGRDLSFKVYCDKKKTHQGRFDGNINCKAIYDHGTDSVSVVDGHRHSSASVSAQAIYDHGTDSVSCRVVDCHRHSSASVSPQAIYDHGTDSLSCRVVDCPVLSGNIKIKFESNSKRVPKSYDKCAFFFWIHSSFFEGERLRLTRDEIDNPHLPRNQHVYHKDFSLEVVFSDMKQPSATSSSCV